jgi:signal transduction histidine kinase/AraC-like DNA-binding protein
MIPDDPFWVSANLAIEQKARQSGVELVPLDLDNVEVKPLDYTAIVEDLLSQEIDALIILEIPKPLFECIQRRKIPVILLAEQVGCHEQGCRLDHFQTVSPFGLYGATRLLADYVLEQLPDHNATVLIVGGMCQTDMGEDGRSKLAALYDTFVPYSSIQLQHIPTSWRYDDTYQKIREALQQGKIVRQPDVIFGLSDSLALAARKALEEAGLLKPGTLVVGYNGDPQALAAIALGTMSATVETSAFDFGIQVVELAVKAASGQALPNHFSFKPRLVTSENVAEVSAQKLIAIAELPNQLVGVNRLREQQRLHQLETLLTINRQIGAILERSELTQKIVNLIRTDYNYDRVDLYLLSEKDQQLIKDEPGGSEGQALVRLDLDEDGLLAQVLRKGELIFVPDMANSQRFSPEPHWPNLRSRVALPLRFGGEAFGVLDLHSDWVRQHNREQLLGLQLMADQVAIAIRNAELFGEAVAARKIAEKADKLKTLLLANVSHEFRTPLNIILGYTKAALNGPETYGTPLPTQLLGDLERVHNSGEHLLHLINDLLDLSQAEIDELEIYPAIIDPRPILEEVFLSMSDLAANQKHNQLQRAISWQFEAPPRLPLIQADPVRLRQILLNLLSNANKFTEQGQITLGVDIQTPYLHLWVEDTGSGIPASQQELIFEPFMVGQNAEHHPSGIGLGLSITRHLVTLHRGLIRLESQPGSGTTFHVYLPLPNLSGKITASPPGKKQILVYISNRAELPAEIEQLGQENKLQIYQLRPVEVRARLLDLQPSILAWDATSASGSDWLAMNYLRTTRQLAQLPLMLYGTISKEANQTGLTNILLKPFSDQSLSTMLEALGPNQLRGEVLIVDDDAQALEYYRQLLEAALPGVVIHQAENGQKAIALLKEIVPSLVILDLVMPEVDGYAVVEWLRSNPTTRNVPVLVISGKVLSSEYVRRLDYPRVAFQTKDILEEEEATGILQKVSEGTNFLSQFNSILVKRAIVYLQDNHARPLSLKEIAQELGISKNHLGEIFHHELGISLWDYLTRYRIKQAKLLLETTDLNVAAISAQVGFDDSAYFSKVFRSLVGQSPKEYRNLNSRRANELNRKDIFKL